MGVFSPAKKNQDSEPALHRRLAFAEAEAKRMGRAGSWQRHMTVAMDDIEPLGRQTQVLSAIQDFGASRWCPIVAGCLAVLLLLSLFICVH